VLYRWRFSIALVLIVAAVIWQGVMRMWPADENPLPRFIVTPEGERPPHTDFDLAFQPGTVFVTADGYEKVCRQVVVGELSVPSGRIVAYDPHWAQYMFQRQDAFSRRIPPGRYAVQLALAHTDYKVGHRDERVACAKLVIRAVRPVHWEMATRPKQDVTKLRLGEAFGYGVDSGTGCFADLQHLSAMSEMDFEEMSRHLDDASSDRSSKAWTVPLPVGRDANLIAFHSGEGDGHYASYWGFDADHEVCCLVTDFGVLTGGVHREITVEGLAGKLDQPIEHPALTEYGVTSFMAGYRDRDETLEQVLSATARVQRHPIGQKMVEEMRKHLPKEGQVVLTFDGDGRIPDFWVKVGDQSLGRGAVSNTGEGDKWRAVMHLDAPLPADARLVVQLSEGARALRVVTKP
jgi:hypothetical protein